MLTATPSVADIIRRHGEMEAKRATWEAHWREVAERVLPRQDDFFVQTQRTEGEKRTSKVFDSLPMMALERFAAVMESILTPRTQLWHRLKPEGPARPADGGPVAEWFDAVNQAMFDARYAPRANFASQAHEGYMSLGAFGTLAMWIDKAPDSPIRYKLCHVAELYFAEDAWGRIDTVHRKFRMTARQLVQKFDKARLPPNVLSAAQSQPDQEHVVLHCVYPNPQPAQGREDAPGMAFVSRYIMPEHSALIEEGGYASFPWAISRYVTAPRETYGRSPAMTALPDIKLLHEAQKSRIKAWHMAIDPPWITSDDGAFGPLVVKPGAVNAGYMTQEGRPTAQALTSGANLSIDQALTDQVRSSISDAFLGQLFQSILNDPRFKTATEILEVVRAAGVLATPVMGRQQSEFLGPLLEREFDLLARAGYLPPPPDELLEQGGGYKVEYLSPLSNAARAEEALGVLKTVEFIGPLAQARPDILDLIDGDEALRVIANANGVPNKVLRDAETVEAIREQRAQQQQLQTMIEAGPALGQTVAGVARAAA